MNFIYYKAKKGKWKKMSQSFSSEDLYKDLLNYYLGTEFVGFKFLFIKHDEKWKFKYMEQNGGIQ